jgi:NAD+ diphosphatase
MSIWEETSSIDHSLDTEWEQIWADGAARIIHISDKARVSLSQPGTPGSVRLDSQSSAGITFDPGWHVYIAKVGTTPIFSSMKPVSGQVDLRTALACVSDTEIQLIMRAAALAQFHCANHFCPQCGSPTRMDDLGRTRFCDSCDTPQFPRTDPAVIVAVTDESDRLLLGHHNGWEANRFSLFAGYVEAGESLEHTVRRELAEEVNMVVTDIVYTGSQPWPMPRSLMVGFTARVLSGSLHPDGVEITEARWFTRSELRESLDRSEVILPTRASIAYRLITAWYGEEL